jgi:tRNA-specific 2-thiouridylase
MKRVFVGLSGGVDSAVSAALLKEQGYEVVGAFIKIWRPEFIECPWQKERLDAMRVCAHLGIPFKEIDLSDEYKKEVIDDMIANYTRGITPNPDVLCNRHIKFGAFKKWAHEQGADLVATGHYAQVVKAGDRFELHRGKDANKDQSYFLWRLREHDLATTLFPVGGYTKPEVRVLAEKFGLPVAAKHDSQGLCFVGEVTMRDFLARYIDLKKGKVVNERGVVIGEHDGAALYTLGERHGFRLETSSAHTEPHYVVAIDPARNTITVSTEKDQAKRDSVHLEDMQWVGETPAMPLQASVQARYRETPIESTILGENVTFSASHLAPPGQSLVIYDGPRLIGGGVITAA